LRLSLRTRTAVGADAAHAGRASWSWEPACERTCERYMRRPAERVCTASALWLLLHERQWPGNLGASARGGSSVSGDVPARGEENLGYRAIADRSITRGYPTYEGKSWTSYTVQHGPTNLIIAETLAYSRKPSRETWPTSCPSRATFPSIPRASRDALSVHKR